MKKTAILVPFLRNDNEFTHCAILLSALEKNINDIYNNKNKYHHIYDLRFLSLDKGDEQMEKYFTPGIFYLTNDEYLDLLHYENDTYLVYKEVFHQNDNLDSINIELLTLENQYSSEHVLLKDKKIYNIID